MIVLHIHVLDAGSRGNVILNVGNVILNAVKDLCVTPRFFAPRNDSLARLN